MTRITDISHRIVDGMPTFPGLPRPRITLHRDHAASRAHYDGRAEFAIGHVECVGNIGTYVDSPFHRWPSAPDVSALPLERLVDLPTVVLDVREAAAADRCVELVLAGALAGHAVLFRTDWDQRWGADEYWGPAPFLGPATVEQLVHHRPALVGVDFWNVDDTADAARPAHTTLLGEGIPIVENLCHLGAVRPRARTSVVPLAVVGAPSLPVRAFALAP